MALTLIIFQAAAHRVLVEPRSVAPLSTLRSAMCECIFLDVGSNVGVHVHKLYEPAAYAASPYTNIFASNFDSRCASRNEVCSVTFEANTAHSFRQEMLARHNQEKGRRAWAIHAAVGPPTGWLTFSDANTLENEGWGFGRNSESGPKADVYAISLSEFVLRFLRKDQHVLVKMDIEGSEYAVLEDLVKTGAIWYIDSLTAEFHRDTMSETTFWLARSFIENRWKRKLAKYGCAVRFVDDESDLHDGVPLEINVKLL